MPSLVSFAWYSLSTDVGRDLGHPADPVDPVGPLDHVGRRVDLGREDGLEVRLVGLAVIGHQPAQVARLRRAGRVGRDGLGDLLPGLAALEVLERGLRLGLGGGLLGVGRGDRAGIRFGLHLDHPGVSRFGRGRLDQQASVDVGRRHGDPFFDGELRLELVVDQPLEGHAGQLLALLADDLQLGLAFGVGQLTGGDGRPDPPLGLVEPPGLDREPIPEVVLGDRLAVDAADRRQVVVVPAQACRDEQDDDRGRDDDAEADVEVEVPSVLAFPRGALGAFDDGLGFEGHERGGSLLAWPAGAGVWRARYGTSMSGAATPCGPADQPPGQPPGPAGRRPAARAGR